MLHCMRFMSPLNPKMMRNSKNQRPTSIPAIIVSTTLKKMVAILSRSQNDQFGRGGKGDIDVGGLSVWEGSEGRQPTL